ncbi:glycosyltransferase family 9 protein [Oceanisphaera sp. W20_SRM_FM3]|uniref:glycosyltransferase family 9 protein n=1 Tax=Oceanisphaera sp. W20_SRM_FM3 TaxID=3240267 RepID=UPI003F9E20F6
MLKKWISSIQLARDIWRRKLGLFLFDRAAEKFELNDSLKRVVLVRWDAKWGDSIVSSFVFREWRKAYPGIKIDVITTPNMSGLFNDHFGADHVYEVKKRPGYSELKKLASEIGDIDLLVHLSKALKMKDLYFMNKVKANAVAGLDDQVKLINLKLGRLTKNKHFSDKYKMLLESTGVQQVCTDYIVPENKLSAININQFLSSIAGPLLVFNPYGSGSSRQLSKDTISDFIEAISSERSAVNIVLLTMPDKKDEVALICEKYNNVYFYGGSQSIYDSIEIMRQADHIISVDTATVHIATGLQKPLLALYNPDEENYKEWHPNNNCAKSVFAQENNPPNINCIGQSIFKEKVSNLFLC